MEIIIRNRNKIKGKSISEMARNLESEGWPSEFSNEEMRDRVQFLEKKKGGPISKQDIHNISQRKG